MECSTNAHAKQQAPATTATSDGFLFSKFACGNRKLLCSTHSRETRHPYPDAEGSMQILAFPWHGAAGCRQDTRTGLRDHHSLPRDY